MEAVCEPQQPDSQPPRAVSQRLCPVSRSQFFPPDTDKGESSEEEGGCLHGLVVASYTPRGHPSPSGETDPGTLRPHGIHTPWLLTKNLRRPTNFPDSSEDRDFSAIHKTKERAG